MSSFNYVAWAGTLVSIEQNPHRENVQKRRTSCACVCVCMKNKHSVRAFKLQAAQRI